MSKLDKDKTAEELEADIWEDAENKKQKIWQTNSLSILILRN